MVDILGRIREGCGILGKAQLVINFSLSLKRVLFCCLILGLTIWGCLGVKDVHFSFRGMLGFGVNCIMGKNWFWIMRILTIAAVSRSISICYNKPTQTNSKNT